MLLTQGHGFDSQGMQALIQMSILNAVQVTLNKSICQIREYKFRLQAHNSDETYWLMLDTGSEENKQRFELWEREISPVLNMLIEFTNTDSYLDERLSLAHQLLSRYFQCAVIYETPSGKYVSQVHKFIILENDRGKQIWLAFSNGKALPWDWLV